MSIEYFAAVNGSVIIRAGTWPNTRRKQLPNVNLDMLKSIAADFSFNECKKLRLALKLQRYSNIYQMTGATSGISADTALANWIGDFEKSIGRLAGIASIDPKKHSEAISAMSGMAKEWAVNENEFDLIDKGIDVQHLPHGMHFGTHHFIEQWFERAKLIHRFAKDTETRLRELNRPRDRLNFGVSKEALFYGNQLPRLYKRLTGKEFGISKIADVVQRTNGVKFALECAEAIGLPQVTPSNVAAHWNNRKSTG